jgi:hypothetical protein
MITLHCSHGLTRELELGAAPALGRATNALGDWYARAVTVEGERRIIAINSRSLLAVVFPLLEVDELVTAFQQAVAHMLLRLGLGPDEVERELVQMTPTILRSTRRADVPGRLYAAMAHARSAMRRLPSDATLLELEDTLAISPRQSLDRRTPADVTLRAFRHTAEVIELDAWRARRGTLRRHT